MHKLILSGNLWMFDSNNLPKIADRLRRAGEAVIGTSSLSARMESDRDYAVGVAESVGLRSPETEKFTDYDSAIDFLEANEDKAYVYKPFKGDPTSTYVPQERDDLAKANRELREYILSLARHENPKFILQEVVEGVEVAFDMWVRDGKPVVAFCDLEAKRKLTGELGGNVGCAGDYVFKVPMSSKGIKETVAKYLPWKELASYTGSVDANVIVTKSGPLFLENCFRFGYNAQVGILHILAKDSVENVLREWASGKQRDLGSMFSSDFAGTLSLMSDDPKEGSPIFIPPEIKDKVDLYRAYKEDDRLCLVEGWPEVACVVSAGKTIESAGQECLKLAEQVAFPEKGYRVDLADNSLPSLPISRFRALQSLSYFR